MSDTLFSVVVPTYNRPAVLSRTLDCLERQDCGFGFEVIVVDDASTETLPELGFEKENRKGWKLVRLAVNEGRAATRNKGIKLARGRYVLLLDDDIWAEPQLLRSHLEKQEEINGGVVIGGIPPAREIKRTSWNLYQIRRFERIRKRLTTGSLDYGLFMTGNVSILRSALDKLGGFDETFREYSFEDTELGYRLYTAGLKFAFAQEAVGHHFFDEDLDKLCKKAYELGRSSHVFAKLHPEETRCIQYQSLLIESWQPVNITKNIIKLILYNKVARLAMKLACTVLAGVGLHGQVMALLPWLELSFRAQGLREVMVEDRR